MSTPMRIGVLTSTRADYGLLQGTIHALHARGAHVQLIVTGTHLSAAHGFTVTQIEAESLVSIAARIACDFTDDSAHATAHIMSETLSKTADVLAELRPDMLVLLGDRYETLAAACAAAMLHIPICHLHGGEVTEGALDESMRHAITKLSYWHIASATPYAKRIVQLGEDPSRVFTIGAPGIDQLAQHAETTRTAFETMLGTPLKPTLVLATFHPETLSAQSPEAQIQPMLDALDALNDCSIIITGTGGDAGGSRINAALEDFVQSRADAHFYLSLGSARYVQAMRHASVIIGNSSSAVIEAPALGRASINIGDRQKGRLRPPTVIDCDNTAPAISAALSRALSKDFQSSLQPQTVFGISGTISAAIADRLLACELPLTPRKTFFDKA